MSGQFTSSGRAIRVAFNDLYNPNWIAGGNYLTNLFIALRSLDKREQPEIMLLSWGHSYDGMKYVDYVLPYNRKPPLYSLLYRVYKHFAGKSHSPLESPLSRVLRGKSVDCFFLKGSAGDDFRLPLLAWTADFQFLRMPDMYTHDEIQQRVETISQVAKNANAVIVSSQDSCSDFAAFAPYALDKTYVLSFVAHMPESVYAVKPTSICDYYQLPERFFYLPNQFFKHKNHLVIIDALKLLKKDHPQIVVVCTGKGSDFRHKDYYEELKKKIIDFELKTQFIHLGVIPQEHVYQLMRQAIALLQPSLFEGWSTSVEEAKSLGKTVVLSDIPVHREQEPPEGLYFDPYQPEQLAQILVEMYSNKAPGPDLTLEAMARRNLLPRMQQFGKSFMQIVKDSIN
ncbi:MAG: glycosyltransferase family 4 protein [Chloroflexota bacterium]